MAQALALVLHLLQGVRPWPLRQALVERQEAALLLVLLPLAWQQVLVGQHSVHLPVTVMMAAVRLGQRAVLLARQHKGRDQLAALALIHAPAVAGSAAWLRLGPVHLLSRLVEAAQAALLLELRVQPAAAPATAEQALLARRLQAHPRMRQQSALQRCKTAQFLPLLRALHSCRRRPQLLGRQRYHLLQVRLQLAH